MHRSIRNLTSLLLAAVLCLSLAACSSGSSQSDDTEQEATQTTQALPASTAEESVPEEAPAPESALKKLRVTALKGPTAMGLVKLIYDSVNDLSWGEYEFRLAASADEVTPSLIKGDIDVACVPANLASVLYNKTEGQIVTLAVNTLGVLYIVETGDTIHSISDLAGKTIVAAGKGSTPEYALRYLLTENGIDPDHDLTIDWKSEHNECVAALASGAADIALLPQPFVTAAAAKVEGLRSAVSLTDAWDALDSGSQMITGVVVARKELVENEPDTIRSFMGEYLDSVDWVNENTDDAASLIGALDIVSKDVAKEALPHCNIVFLYGKDMRKALSGYLEVLFNAEPASVGGALPESDFYYDA